MDEQNATPEGGASVLERLEARLNPAASESPAPETQPDAGESPEVPDSVEPDSDGQAETEESQLTTSDLSKLLGIDETLLDVDTDGTVKLKTKIDGEEGHAKLSDLLKSYQLEGHVNRKSMEVAAREKAAAELMQKAESQAKARLEQVESLANVAANELMREFNSVDWNTLERADPGQAALMRQKFQERQMQLQNVFNTVEQNKAQQTQQDAQRQQEMMAQEAQKLPELIPEWKDQAVAEKERGEIREWALKNGFTPEELGQVAFARHVAVLRKAALFDKLQQSKPAIDNKVRTAPKLVRPGQAAQNTQAMTARSLKQNVIKSGGKGGSIEEFLIATGKI